MSTCVTFANVSAGEPRVFVTPGEKFVLLVSSVGKASIRDDWHPGSQRACEHETVYAMNVTYSPDGLNQQWILETHRESPSRRRIPPMSCCEANHKGWVLSADGADRVRVAAGEVYRFSVSSKWLSEEIRFMLNRAGKSAKPGFQPKTKKAQTTQPAAIKLNLDTLPTEMLREILSYVTWMDIIYTLPYVSKRMFTLIRSGDVVHWDNLDFRRSTPSLADVRFLCMQGLGDCKSLSFMHVHKECQFWHADAVPALTTALVHGKWEKLTELRIDGEVLRCHLFNIQNALTVAAFPLLEKLVWANQTLSNEKAKGVKWEYLLTAKLKELTHLGVEILGEQSIQGCLVLEDLPKLKSLHLCLEPKRNLLSGLFPAPFEGEQNLALEELKIIGVQHGEEPALLRELGSLRRGKLVRLCLSGWDFIKRGCPLNQVDLYTATVPGNRLLSLFSSLRTLALGRRVDLTWTSVPQFALSSIEELRVSLSPLSGVVPFEKFINLDSLWVEVSIPPWWNGLASIVLQFRAFLALPGLKTLRVSGPNALTAMKECLQSAQPNAMVVSFIIHCPRIDASCCSMLATIFEGLPGLRRLKIVSEFAIPDPEQLASVVARRLKKLIQLDLTFGGKNYWFTKNAGEDVEAALLSQTEFANWQVSWKYEDWPVWKKVVVLTQGGCAKLPKKCFSLDDPFFLDQCLV